MKNAIKTILFFSLIAISYSASAQYKESQKTWRKNKENLQKLVNNPKKMKKFLISKSNMPATKWEKKYNIKNGYCTIEDYKIPKKVLITSFIIEDDKYITFEHSKSKGYYSTTYSTTTTTTQASDKKVNIIAQLMFEQSVDKMKKTFADLGMELVTPKEYCNTEELKKLYYDTELPILTKNIILSKSDNAAVPDNFRFYPQGHTRFTAGKVQKEWDSYLKSLKLDGFLSIAINMSASGEFINSITVNFTYKNPGNQDIYVVGYSPFPTASSVLKFDRLRGIYEKKEIEYLNKKGKKKTKFGIVDLNPNLGELINFPVLDIATKLTSYITKPLKK